MLPACDRHGPRRAQRWHNCGGDGPDVDLFLIVPLWVVIIVARIVLLIRLIFFRTLIPLASSSSGSRRDSTSSEALPLGHLRHDPHPRDFPRSIPYPSLASPV